MKKLRSLVAALVALLMVFSLAPAALADGEKATEAQYVSTEEYDEETNTSIYQDITKSYGSIIVTNEDAVATATYASPRQSQPGAFLSSLIKVTS